jgi:polyisoprenoid-binding protein YceI
METTVVAVTPGAYRLDHIHSTVGFAVLHKVSKFRATFADFDATLTADPSRELTLTGAASVRSVQVKNKDMETHLQSPDFFDAERYPDAGFRSTSVRLDPGGELAVTGELTIRGHTRSVEARGTLTSVPDDGHGRERVGLDLEAVIDRQDFGVSFSQRLPGGGLAVANAVTLNVELELVKN